VTASYDTVDQLVRGAGPALLEVPGDGTPKFLALLNGNQRAASLLGPDFPLDVLYHPRERIS